MTSSPDITFLPSVDGTTVCLCHIGMTPRGAHRKAEKDAVAHLLKHRFGDGARLLHDDAGAPSVHGFDGHISVSHSPRIAFLAVDPKCPVGIDAEPWRDSLKVLAPRFMKPCELDVYGSDPRLILRAWTAKEAAFKALGMPQLVISDIILPPDPEATVVRICGRTLSLHFFEPVEGHAVTLAKLPPDQPL